MKPIEFVVFDGDSQPDLPAYNVARAMFNDIKILGCDGEYSALSYYYDEDSGRLVLDIAKKGS